MMMGSIPGLEGGLNAFEDEGAEGIGDIEDDDADGAAALVAERLSVPVGGVAEALGGGACGGTSLLGRRARQAVFR